MDNTSIFGLKKPAGNEYINVQDLNDNMDTVDEKIGTPEFDDSGTVGEITSFPTYLATLVSGMIFFRFFRNLKAGLQFVLHAGAAGRQLCYGQSKFAVGGRAGQYAAESGY